MSNPFVAEIRIFPFQFAPKGWAMCDGQLLPISQNTALFSLLGTYYGGDGKSNFALPNLQGSVAVHTDQYSGGGQYPIGAEFGEDSVTLLQSEMPQHAHTLQGDTTALNARASSPNGAIPGHPSTKNIYGTGTSNTTMNPSMIGVAGNSSPHNNLMPYLTLNYCIALQGVYPPRT